MNAQDHVREFCKKHKLSTTPEHHLLDLVAEIGEVSKDILKMSDYGRKKLKKDPAVAAELGDVFYSLCTVANALDVDLEDALHIVLKKYEKRLKKGSPGSEHE